MSKRAKNSNFERAIKLLNKHQAPENLIGYFKELADINELNHLGEDINVILLDACREFAFIKPFEKKNQRKSFRARLLPNTHPDYDSDGPDWLGFEKPRLIAREQAYRRGYDQGFYEALSMFKRKERLKDIEDKLRLIHEWRTRYVQIIGSLPGSLEDKGDLKLVQGRSLSLRTRWRIFERDNFCCRVCGLSSKENTKLEIDHKISVADGGGDEDDNLWTLCFDCNRGKHSKSFIA